MRLRAVNGLPIALALVAGAMATPAAAQSNRLLSQDLTRLRDVGQVALSPDGTLVAYAVASNDRPGRPYSQLWGMNLATGQSVRPGGNDDASSSDATWSPDGRSVVFHGAVEGKAGLVVARSDGSAGTWLANVSGTNSPLPGQGADIHRGVLCRRVASAPRDLSFVPQRFGRIDWRCAASWQVRGEQGDQENSECNQDEGAEIRVAIACGPGRKDGCYRASRSSAADQANREAGTREHHVLLKHHAQDVEPIGADGHPPISTVASPCNGPSAASAWSTVTSSVP